MNFSVDELFKVLNLLMRIGLVVYIIKRYVIGQIVLYITQEKNEIDLLQQQRARLKQESESIEKTMKTDEIAFQVMQEKFVLWDNTVKATHAQEQMLCQERQKTMNILTRRKLESLQRRHLIQTEISGIISQTARDLEQTFQSDTALGQKYITKVLDALAE